MDRPWLVAIVGPPAVGKMTVGQQLAARTGFPLYYNHQVIDLLTPYFEFGSPSFERLSREYRRRFFEETAQAGMGIVATWSWWFEHPPETAAVEYLIEPFLEAGGRVSFAELVAPLDVRLRRNRTEHRRAQKRTDWATDEELTAQATEHSQNTTAEHPFPWPDRHLRLENAELAPDDAAARIQAHFGLPSVDGA
ncbi:MAG: AAA family ATPase [Chloroflexi bacterium]|nr:AAA family ATPase [Chloroflexota bacterium]MDA1146112.1 AAA family ATPase [Chloroflexota bacterium]